MKVAVITLHRVTNFGSLLQTYATQKSLEQLGCQVETIDFVPEGLTFFRSVWPKGHSTVKRLIKLLPLTAVNLIQFSMSDRFLRQHIHLSKKRYGSFADLAKDCPRADVYLSGSDQVWNTQNSNPPADLGAYYLACLKVGESKESVRDQLQAVEAMLRQGCAGQLPEIYDGDHPTDGKGCFGQAWSVGEMLRVFEAIEK